MSPGSHIPCLYYFLSEMRHNRLKDMLFQVKPHRSQLAPFPADILGGELEIHPGLTQCNLTRWKRNPDTECFFSRRNILDPVIITSPHSWTVFFIKQMLEDKTCIYTFCFCQQNYSLSRFSTAISLNCRILNFTDEEFCVILFQSI